MPKNTIWDEEFGLLEYNGQPTVSSRKVAEVFEKPHNDVLKVIRKLTEEESGLSKDFTAGNFSLSSYKDVTGRKQPEYLLTRDGFALLAMGFTGKRAMQFKEAYIKRFNDMEQFILALDTARMEFPELTQAILITHEHPKHYHFSNEMDMINRVVLGMTAKQFKESRQLVDVQSIRPYLSESQIRHIGMLQKADIGFVLMGADYPARKEKLQEYYFRIKMREAEAITG